MNTESVNKTRYVTVSEFKRTSGLSHKTIMHLINSGQVRYLVTESGHYRIDTMGNVAVAEYLVKTLNNIQNLAIAISKHLNVIQGG